MMFDVERLRDAADEFEAHEGGPEADTARAAADEIERLRAGNRFMADRLCALGDAPTPGWFGAVPDAQSKQED